jgi:hypothetical protein
MRSESADIDMTMIQPISTSLPKINREQIVANAAFFFLFPGFFFYHTLLGTGTTNAFLGGYFSPVSLLFVFPLLGITLRRFRHQKYKISYIELNYGAFLGYFLAVIFLNSMAGANQAIVINHLLCILFMINAFIIFSVINFASQIFRAISLISLCGMSAIALSYSVNGVFYLGALGAAKDFDSLATYQGFARSYLVTFLPVIAFTRLFPLRLALYVMSVSTLFVNTARSEFVALLFVIPIIEFYYSQKKLLFILTAALVGLFLQLNVDHLMMSLPDNRIMELIDLSQSTSANKRHHLTMYALQTISAHPLLGDYASYTPGYYSHNILSAWVDLGFFGFIYLICILIAPALPMFLREYFSNRHSGNFILGFGMACSTSLLLITSHYFTDMLIGATLGVYTQYLYGRANAQRRTSNFSASPLRHEDICQTVPKHGSLGL